MIKMDILKRIRDEIIFYYNNFCEEKLFYFFSTKINIGPIIKEYLKSIITSKYKYKDIFTFVIFPAIISVMIIYLFNDTKINFDVNIIVTSLALFIPILFSLLVVLFGINKKAMHKKDLKRIKEFKSNVWGIILTSLICIFLIVFYGLKLYNSVLFDLFLKFFILFFLCFLGLNLFLLIKRLNKLLDDNLKDIEIDDDNIF